MALLYVAGAPLLLLAAMLMRLTSLISLAVFGHDPAASLVEGHPEAWTVFKLTGRCTLCLFVVGLVLRVVV